MVDWNSRITYDVQPLTAPAHAPDDVIAAVAQIVAGMGRAGQLQCAQVQLREPLARNEAAEQIAHHGGMRVQQLIAAVMAWVAMVGFRCFRLGHEARLFGRCGLAGAWHATRVGYVTTNGAP